ncbi:protease complex subunit PrcB family protein [Methanocaldococcus indicus]|uniref:protease complex subunit PrcB family protein n=1 Tax=Methanocaldococcus indicus TaxID=213231 RepID=UPI003C6D8CD7
MKYLIVLLIFLLLTGCVNNTTIEKNNNSIIYNYNNKDINKNTTITINNTIKNDIISKKNIVKNLSYKILSFGYWGEKEKRNYYYYKDNKTIIVINLGEKPSGGYKIKVLNITLINNTANVYYRVVPPKDFAITVITYPYIKLEINGIYKVEFHEVR